MSRTQIAVIDSGWVLVGEVLHPVADTSPSITFVNASVVRVWGTDKGLGQIALNGPTKTTVLDKIGTVYIERAQLKFLIDCDDSRWKK